MSRVTLQGLAKSYRQTAVVRDVDLTIEEGEFVVLLGPSGCGKTTTLRMIAGLTEPTLGAIRIGATDVTRLPPRARNLGMVFQDYALFPNMTVAENIGFGLAERRVARAETHQRVSEMLALIRLEGFGARYPAQLSGGQQQRVALARALAYRPRVLLMDEPLGALDQKLREEMQRELIRIQRDLRITTVFVTHDQQEAMALADRIVVMNHGRIEQSGTPRALYRDPATLFIATFIGRSNQLAGTAEAAGRDRVTVRLAGGAVIEAANKDHATSGARVVCVVRPEHVALGIAPLAGRNAIVAKLQRRNFRGDSVDLILADRAGQELLVQVAEGWAPPSEALVAHFAPADTLCFKAEDAS
ncbi:MAG TPA: ABC transporter ATP-binding protein [Xanthobacteraceae bacterium]|nr:ABC transporter ATP-binding protein [Xanthobacteraceae bacterium]